MTNVIVTFSHTVAEVTVTNTMMVNITAWGSTAANDYNVGVKFTAACTTLGFTSPVLVSYAKLDMIFNGS